MALLQEKHRRWSAVVRRIQSNAREHARVHACGPTLSPGSLPVRACFCFCFIFLANRTPHARLGHIILTLRSTNLLHVENLFDSEAAAELTEQVLGFWQHGINRQSHNRGKWKVEFAGSPWASVGLDGILYVIVTFLLPSLLQYPHCL